MLPGLATLHSGAPVGEVGVPPKGPLPTLPPNPRPPPTPGWSLTWGRTSLALLSV